MVLLSFDLVISLLEVRGPIRQQLSSGKHLRLMDAVLSRRQQVAENNSFGGRGGGERGTLMKMTSLSFVSLMVVFKSEG